MKYERMRTEVIRMTPSVLASAPGGWWCYTLRVGEYQGFLASYMLTHEYKEYEMLLVFK